jgi:hypothetical protein
LVPCLSTLGHFGHMAASRSFPKITRKMHLIQGK